MFSFLTPVVFVTCWIFGALHLTAGFGFLLSRRRAVFAIRVPLVVFGCMVCKFICFLLLVWLFLDENCPCALTTVMLMFEFAGNFCNLLRKTVLLFRYRIQATLDSSKQAGGPLILDEKDFFVRHRHILRSRGQFEVFSIIMCISILGFGPLIFIFLDEAAAPCVATSWLDNRLSFWTVMLMWAYFIPVLALSVYLTNKIKNFPKDNWRMGTESSITSLLVVVEGITGIVTLSVVTNFEAILFSFYCYTVVLQLINYLVPLQLHRETVRRLAKSNLEQLASLAHLLKTPEFLEPFSAFLVSEFSSENLSFWLAIEHLKQSYSSFVPLDCLEDGSRSQRISIGHKRKDTLTQPSFEAMVRACADQCIYLARQYVGDQAQWQLNLSGETRLAVELAVDHLKPEGGTDRANMENALRALIAAQAEIYEGLRKDPYPRFLLTPESALVNKSETLKRLLAAEKLEENIPTPQISPTVSPQHSRHSQSASMDDSSNPRLLTKRPMPTDGVGLGFAGGGRKSLFIGAVPEELQHAASKAGSEASDDDLLGVRRTQT